MPSTYLSVAMSIRHRTCSSMLSGSSLLRLATCDGIVSSICLYFSIVNGCLRWPWKNYKYYLSIILANSVGMNRLVGELKSIAYSLMKPDSSSCFSKRRGSTPFNFDEIIFTRCQGNSCTPGTCKSFSPSPDTSSQFADVSRTNISSVVTSDFSTSENFRSACAIHSLSRPCVRNGLSAFTYWAVKRNGVSSGSAACRMPAPNDMLKSMPINSPVFWSIRQLVRWRSPMPRIQWTMHMTAKLRPKLLRST